jgi:glycosyltransferase involved in cell wall biosynthesis
LKTITLVSAGLSIPDRAELLRMEAADLCPRSSLFYETLNSDRLDESFLERAPAFRRLLYTPLPKAMAQIAEAMVIKRRYDAVITWAELLGLPFAALLKLTGVRVPHITISSWISKRKKAELLRRVHSYISRIVLMSSVQRDFATDVLNIPRSRIAFLKWPVDQRFWRPTDGIPDMICSVGAEGRDYLTLIAAMKGLPMQCHLAAGTHRSVLHPTVRAITETGPLPENVLVGKKSFMELRALYARSRFVVIPLLPSDTDHGATSILEAMAMGKAVICSRTVGQRDVIQEGKTGIFVPLKDPGALREAIQFLWNNPDVAERMGNAGRKHIEEHHTLDQFVSSVKGVVEEAIEETGSRSVPRNRNGSQASRR